MNGTLIIVFLKEPQPGRVKTRIGNELGHGVAAALYRQLATEVLGIVAQSPSSRVRICYDSVSGEGAIREWVEGLWPEAAVPVDFRPQGDGDLGIRLSRAFHEGFQEGFQHVAVVGTDCVELTPGDFKACWEALEDRDAVFGPSADGGYYLLGLKRFDARLFDVPWSQPDTLERSLERAAEAGFSTARLRECGDIDTVEDWNRRKAALLGSGLRPDQPLVFQPLYKERIWGGRTMEGRLGRELPEGGPVGESWEFVDRDEDQSVVAEGPWAGVTLGELWRDRRDDVFGPGLGGERFPLLVKILDATQDLSIQVHPPEKVAAELGGEPKTEMWYIAHAEPGAKLYVGLKRGVTREDFGASLKDGSAAEKVHGIDARTGDFIFIPSGRLHAIGAGLLIYEIQQNSDTTYRVFDWNRVGLDGKPRELHIEPALRSIDFDDLEPDLNAPDGETLVNCQRFVVEKWDLGAGESRPAVGDAFAIVTVVSGRVSCGARNFGVGDFFLIPAGAPSSLNVRGGADGAAILRTTLPRMYQGELQRIDRAEMAVHASRGPESEGFYRRLRARVVEWAEGQAGQRSPWLKQVLMVPDFFHLICALAADRDVPAKQKAMLGGVIAYFFLPLDLLPEALFGPIGFLDDLALAAFALNQLVNHVDPAVIRRHWSGEGDALEQAQALMEQADEMLGSGLVRRVRQQLGI